MFASRFFEPCHRTEPSRIRTFSCMRSRNSTRQPTASSCPTSSRCRATRVGSCCSSGRRGKTVTWRPAAVFSPSILAHRRTGVASMNAEYSSMLRCARSTSHSTASRTSLCSKKAGRASSSADMVANWSASRIGISWSAEMVCACASRWSTIASASLCGARCLRRKATSATTTRWSWARLRATLRRRQVCEDSPVPL